MAKKSAIARNNKRMRMVNKYMDIRTELKGIANDPKTSFEEKMEASKLMTNNRSTNGWIRSGLPGKLGIL